MLEPDDPKWVEADAIKRAADRGAALTKRLLAFSRPHGASATVVDLVTVVTGHGADAPPARARQNSDRVTSAQPTILVRADETALNQIVLNLVVNARDAMPDGGTATIDMKRGRDRRTARARRWASCRASTPA